MPTGHMQTVVIRVRNAQAGQPWPVELCVDDGAAGWHERVLASGEIPADPPALKLPAMTGGQHLALADIVPFMLDHSESAAYVSIGQYLFDLLHNSGIGSQWDELGRQHGAPAGAGLRTLLSVLPQQLADLPWELMTNKQRSLFMDPRNPMSRGPADLLEEVSPYLVPMRVLVVVGDPHDPLLQWAEELDAIREGLRSYRGQVEARYLLGPTRDELVEIHGDLQPEVFHFIGHGIESPTGMGPSLLFRKGAARTELVGADIVNLLTTQTARLAVLNACRTDQAKDAATRVSLHDTTRSLTDAFRAAGYRTVVGMRADIPASAAVAFAGRLYRTLAHGEPIDVAVAEARRSMSVRPDAPANPLFLRDWALPSLVVSVPPTHALAAKYDVTDGVLDAIERTDEFREIFDFVDRTEMRRHVRGRLEATGEYGTKDLMVVVGQDRVGKSSLVKHCLRTCAWRGRTVRYLSFAGENSLDLPGVLHIIHNGSSGSYVSRPLPPRAGDRLVHDLSYLSRGVPAPPYDGHAMVGGGDTTWEPGEQLENVFVSLAECLRIAADGAPFIIALDQLENVEPAAFRQLAEHLLLPVARGELAPVRLIVVLRSPQMQQPRWPQDLTSMAHVVHVDEIAEDFAPLAREFVRHHKFELESVSPIIDEFSKALVGTSWAPAVLRDIKQALEGIKAPRSV